MKPVEPAATELAGGTYDLLRRRLEVHAAALAERVAALDARRREVFGSIEPRILQADRITTAHNCVPRDLVQLDEHRFLFGFNVRFGLKREVDLGDVLAIYRRQPTGEFREDGLESLSDPRFVADFKRLYHVYQNTSFRKFSLVESRLYLVFQIGPGSTDIAVFRWMFEGGKLVYGDGRAEQEYRRTLKPAIPFSWRTPGREAFRYGDHPHVSIEDRVFVECIGGDLTIKVEDNTATGQGLYSEPVEDRNQKVDDAQIAYATVGPLVLLQIRPYKEKAARCFIYNAKVQQVDRIDSIGETCALLPEDHGLVFPDGYYLVTGGLKRFETRERGLVLERVVHAPNGEDSLFIFYGEQEGIYALMAYRLIAQRVEERIACHGFSLFPNGHLLLLHGDPEPQKHHLVQLRQTPFHEKGHEPPGRRDAFLYQVGNKPVVRCLAEVNEILSLCRRESPYAELYDDLVHRCDAVLDAYPWLTSAEGLGVDAALREVRGTAHQAVDEFEKVRRLRREAQQKLAAARASVERQTGVLRRASFRTLEEHVRQLTDVRRLRGELIALREVRYLDVDALQVLEAGVATQADDLGKATVQFLLRPEALEPYRQRAAESLGQVEKVGRAAEGRKLAEGFDALGADLEMLIGVVNSLAVGDAAETTRIIDAITGVYASLNQARAALRKRLQALATEEGAAQFEAQLKLLGQSAASALDLCDTPEKCDEAVNRISVQLEEMEGAFADFEGYAVRLAERRTEIHEAFEQRKLQLVEQRARRAASMMEAADRILKVVRNRLLACTAVEEIQAYLATDLMVGKVREITGQLLNLGDPARSDELAGRLKALQQDALRQLRDRQDLFVGGANVVQLGRHRFNTNLQALDLTVVLRGEEPHVHLTGTQFFEPISDPAYLALREVWGLEFESESAEVYRAEFLAWQMLEEPAASGGGVRVDPQQFLAAGPDERLALVQEFMARRMQDGHTKGIHDADAAVIFAALAEQHVGLRLARYPAAARACAWVYWHRFCPGEERALWQARLEGLAARRRLFPDAGLSAGLVRDVEAALKVFLATHPLFESTTARPAAEYLVEEQLGGGRPIVSREADAVERGFRQHLSGRGAEADFATARGALGRHPTAEWELVGDWMRAFAAGRSEAEAVRLEAAALVFAGLTERSVVEAASVRDLDGLRGSHPRLQGSALRLDYLEFRDRLTRHEREVVPRFREFRRRRQHVLDEARARLRLEELRPRVLTSFVRNQLIDRVYLPLVGDNLAKQMGTAGETKRTDLMGMLLVISPPGYGKTTLLEYIASRLGLAWVKINGPALGHRVTSLDPQEAPNASARAEVERLNLALEMADNVMICVDDIQHCSPEFLQRFISLCDGQRRMEGVWRGVPRTYDLRGRKVVVVMAGNPYTESGQKFRIPDMLANRADTYNLGDIIGGNAEWFRASYLENAVTSNPVLAPLATRGPGDVRLLIRAAEAGPGDTVEGLEGGYSAAELAEILAVLRRLIAVRDVVLRVNQEYIHSAGQADEFRTEPPFRLQGSYRNMNRLAEKVVPVMTEAEVRALILDHYRGEAQTLTQGAEANLLKFRQLMGELDEAGRARWEEICRTFQRNQTVRGVDGADPVSRVVAQLAQFHAGLEGIRESLSTRASTPENPPPVVIDLQPLAQAIDHWRAEWKRPDPAPAAADGHPAGDRLSSVTHELEMLHSTLASLKDLAAQQRDHLRQATDLLATRARQGTVEFELTQEMLTNEQAFLERFHQVLAAAQGGPPPPAGGTKESQG